MSLHRQISHHRPCIRGYDDGKRTTSEAWEIGFVQVNGATVWFDMIYVVV